MAEPNLRKLARAYMVKQRAVTMSEDDLVDFAQVVAEKLYESMASEIHRRAEEHRRSDLDGR